MFEVGHLLDELTGLIKERREEQRDAPDMEDEAVPMKRNVEGMRGRNDQADAGNAVVGAPEVTALRRASRRTGSNDGVRA